MKAKSDGHAKTELYAQFHLNLHQQRTREISIRKVLGASVSNLWQLLSRDFVLLVIIFCAISVPAAWHFKGGWLENYKYHSEMFWWIFAATTAGALLIRLLRVSFKAIRAAYFSCRSNQYLFSLGSLCGPGVNCVE